MKEDKKKSDFGFMGCGVHVYNRKFYLLFTIRLFLSSIDRLRNVKCEM